MSLIIQSYSGGSIRRDSNEWVVAYGDAFPPSESPRYLPPNGSVFWRTDFAAWFYWDKASESWLGVGTSVVHTTTVTSIAATPYTVVPTDLVLLVDATAGDVTILLPAASQINGRRLDIKKIDASANSVIITPAGADTIDGDATVELLFEDESVPIVSDGMSEWSVL